MLSKLLFALRSALVCTLPLAAAASLAQTTIQVGPGQTYSTIQSGIDAANAGDTVLVAPGTYNENINFKGKAITVTSSGGASKTIIDGGSKAPAVSFVTNETAASIISGFTIQHGGNFLSIVSGSYNSAFGSINVASGSPTISNNIITLSNCWGIMTTDGGAPTILNNTISATHDIQGGCPIDGGAAIFLFGGVVDLSYPDGFYAGLVSGNTIENNVEASLEDGSPGGAGIVSWGGVAIITNNIIRNNFSYGTGTAINISSDNTVFIFQNLIYGNGAGCGGGAISTIDHAAYIINNTIVDNIWTNQGGSTACTDIAQIYPDPGGPGVNTPSEMILNNIVSGSTSYPAVNCAVPNEAYQPTFQNNILYNAGGPFFGSQCVDVSGKYNNIAADPQFTDPAHHNYTLKSTSPAIDHGQNSVLQTAQSVFHQIWSKDFAGNPRVADVTGNGCIIDIGAYEYPSTRNDCGVSETLTSSLNPARAGQSVTFTAQLTAQTGAGSGTPTGLIEFLDGTTLLASQAVTSTGSAAFTTSTLTVGSHTITANYQPTGSFSASTASLTQVITGDATGTTLTCLPNPIDVDKTSLLTATVTSANGTPAGSVAFTDNAAPLRTQALLNGTASLTYTGTSAGTHTIVAAYTPTGSFSGSSATCSEVVNALPTTSDLTITPPTFVYDSPATLTATVLPATLPGPSTPAGVVTFYNGSSAIGTGILSGGVTTLVIDSLAGGSYDLTCSYSGSAVYSSSNCNTVPVVVHPAAGTLTLSSSSDPAFALSPVTFTARLTVNGQSAGAGHAIRLSVNGQTTGLTTDATGSAAYTIASLLPNSYPVIANFAGTNSLLASAASLTEVIQPIPTSISITGTPNPGNVGQQVTLSATVSSQNASSKVNGGSVTFYDGPTSLGSAQVIANGTANLIASFSVVGVHNITAHYSGDADFSNSSSAVYQETIVAGDFSISVQPGAATLYTGESASIKVNVAGLQGFSQPLTLTCAGLPANTTCTFTPASLPDGQGNASLVIQTTAPHKAAKSSISKGAAVLGAITLLLLPGWKRRRGFLTGLSVVLLSVGLGMGIAGCGSATPITGGTPPAVYQVAVTATTAESSIPLSHAATVTLTVKSLF